MVKLVLLYVVSLKVGEPVDVEDLLYYILLYSVLECFVENDELQPNLS